MTCETKGFLFDFNGTLFNDTRFHMAAWKKFVRERFSLELSDNEVRRRFIGPGNDDIFRKDLGVSDEALIRAYEREKEEAYREAARTAPELVAGVPRLFDLLTERKIPFCVATASPYENVRFYLDELGLGRWMDIGRIVYEDGLRPGKPDPAFYREAARRIGLTPEECTVVEDSATGILAAKNAHAGRLIVIATTTPRETLEKQSGIAAVIDDFRDFDRYL